MLSDLRRPLCNMQARHQQDQHQPAAYPAPDCASNNMESADCRVFQHSAAHRYSVAKINKVNCRVPSLHFPLGPGLKLDSIRIHAGAVPNLMQAVLWIWPVMYNSIYGRFLLLQLGTTSNIVILNVLISVYNVAGRLASRQVRLLQTEL
jgi:hypothetical protein